MTRLASESGEDIKRHARSYISGNSDIILKNNPGSAIVGYGLKIARIPCRINVANRESCLYVHNEHWIIFVVVKNAHWNFRHTGAT